ncbi:MAG: V-type ATP synthase subunit E family protein [Nitrososphaeraceae archaeon]|jgi:V/A-type H+/Na+-transporting ATPase subunit E
MSSNSALERTVNKVLSQKESDMITQIDSAYHESMNNLESSRTSIESDYERIIDAARKQADNLKRQVIGSTRLNARNKQLLLVEAAVNEVFEKAKVALRSVGKDENYKQLMNRLLDEGLSAIGKDDMIVECSKTDMELVKKLTAFSDRQKKIKLTLSEKPIDAIGGVRVRSADLSLTYDGTLDSRIERLKPLIRKSIVQMLRGEG